MSSRTSLPFNAFVLALAIALPGAWLSWLLAQRLLLETEQEALPVHVEIYPNETEETCTKDSCTSQPADADNRKKNLHDLEQLLLGAASSNVPRNERKEKLREAARRYLEMARQPSEKP